MTAPPAGRGPGGPEPAERADRDATAERTFARAEGLGRARAAESRAAAVLVQDFARRAAAAGLSATRLRARSCDGHASYRTNVEGWYIRRDHSIGIGNDGLFYVLSTPTSLAARVTGVVLRPDDAPLELGRGARDGESIPLAAALERRLAAGDAFP